MSLNLSTINDIHVACQNYGQHKKDWSNKDKATLFQAIQVHYGKMYDENNPLVDNFHDSSTKLVKDLSKPIIQNYFDREVPIFWDISLTNDKSAMKNAVDNVYDYLRDQLIEQYNVNPMTNYQTSQLLSTIRNNIKKRIM